MATVDSVRQELKKFPRDHSLVMLIDGQYYDVTVNNIRAVHVKPEKDFEGNDCYGIADKEDPDSFEVVEIY